MPAGPSGKLPRTEGKTTSEFNVRITDWEHTTSLFWMSEPNLPGK